MASFSTTDQDTFLVLCNMFSQKRAHSNLAHSNSNEHTGGKTALEKI